MDGSDSSAFAQAAEQTPTQQEAPAASTMSNEQSAFQTTVQGRPDNDNDAVSHHKASLLRRVTPKTTQSDSSRHHSPTQPISNNGSNAPSSSRSRAEDGSSGDERSGSPTSSTATTRLPSVAPRGVLIGQVDQRDILEYVDQARDAVRERYGIDLKCTFSIVHEYKKQSDRPNQVQTYVEIADVAEWNGEDMFFHHQFIIGNDRRVARIQECHCDARGCLWKDKTKPDTSLGGVIVDIPNGDAAITAHLTDIKSTMLDIFHERNIPMEKYDITANVVRSAKNKRTNT